MKIAIPALFLFVSLGGAETADLTADLTACRAIQADSERLGCYDSIGRMPGAPATEETEPDASNARHPAAVESSKAAAKEVPEFNLSQAAVQTPASVVAEPPLGPELPSAEDSFGMSAAEIRREQEERLGEEELLQLQAKVIKLRTISNRKVEILLDNGQAWRQVSSSYLRLKVGDDIVIKRAALDSYRLVKVGNNRPMQVRRAD